MSKRIIYECSVKIDDLDFSVLLDDNYCGHSIPSSIHDHPAFEAHFVQTGQYTLQIDRGKLQLSGGTGCVIKPSIYHSVFPEEQDTVKYCFKFYSFSQSTLLSQIMKSEKWKDGIFIYDQISDEMRMMQQILYEFEHRAIGYQMSIDNLFSQLLLTVIRKIIDIRHPKGTPIQDPDNEVLVNVIDEYLYRNYMKNISLSDVAQHLKVSERQVNRLMLNLYGSSFKQKIIQIRLIAAKNMLLQDKHATQAQISEAVGYNDPYYFAKVFKETTGMTPDEFRKASNCSQTTLLLIKQDSNTSI
ncbi:MAG TPA: hypothetical protein DDZ89_10045 [Clostridiales bacterium]|nr:hypothetical protein [Clostridiales bacterium]